MLIECVQRFRYVIRCDHACIRPGHSRPNVDQIIVTATGQILEIRRPLEAAHFLCVTAQRGHVVFTCSNIMVNDRAVSAARRYDERIPGQRANASRMAVHYTQSMGLRKSEAVSMVDRNSTTQAYHMANSEYKCTLTAFWPRNPTAQRYHRYHRWPIYCRLGSRPTSMHDRCFRTL